VHPFVIALLGPFLCLTAAQSGLGNIIVINTGPSANGTKFITVKTYDGKEHDVSVPVTEGMTQDQVNTAIVDAMTAEGIDAFRTRVSDFSTGVGVGGDVTRIDTDSKETDSLYDFGTFDIASVTTGLGGTLTGVDSLGNPSSFTAGFELSSAALGDIAISTSTSASVFAGTPTISGVLQLEYNNLCSQLQIKAPSLAGDLSLDLSNSQMLFAMPQGLTLAGVTGGTTDAGGTSGETWSVPEPSSLALLLGTGLLTLRRLRRQAA